MEIVGEPEEDDSYKFFIPKNQTYTGCPKKNETGFLLNISATNDRIFKSFFSPEN